MESLSSPRSFTALAGNNAETHTRQTRAAKRSALASSYVVRTAALSVNVARSAEL